MRAKPSPLFIVPAIALLLANCMLDHRKNVSYSVLYKQDGFEDDKVFSAAIAAKFPPGTPASELRHFAASNGGECTSKHTGSLVCEITTRAIVCAARWVRIEATLDGEAVISVSSSSAGIGC